MEQLKLKYFYLQIIFLITSMHISCKSSIIIDNNFSYSTPFQWTKILFNNIEIDPNNTTYDIDTRLTVKLIFSKKINVVTARNSISLNEVNQTSIPLQIEFGNKDSSMILTSMTALKYLTSYELMIDSNLTTQDNQIIKNKSTLKFNTKIDSTDKFPRISDSALLDLIESQTFKYFWDFGHPISGLARERSNEGLETVTSGGSGFGIMSIPVAIKRRFINRSEGLNRMQLIVNFLLVKAQKFHGAFPHWINGRTGQVIPFSVKDNGADLVETSYLLAGLLTIRQYFDRNDPDEAQLRKDINLIWNAVEWSWFTQNQNVLFWHWSPNYLFEMNHKIEGWNECLITYILAASTATFTVNKETYTEGYAKNGLMKNNKFFYNLELPLGPDLGGPLFFSHYSFLGINPMGLSDAFADYKVQVTNHSMINYYYCVENPKKYFGYNGSCWGLTASDIPNGYSANEPSRDIGVISPTAALSSMPYSPQESMQALRYFYYILGDKLWSKYGFKDAFSLQNHWFADSHLAIDQGPIIIMIENYRSQLIWDLLMSCPEIKLGLNKLGFKYPH